MGVGGARLWPMWERWTTLLWSLLMVLQLLVCGKDRERRRAVRGRRLDYTNWERR
jgi:hypothetical protein